MVGTSKGGGEEPFFTHREVLHSLAGPGGRRWGDRREQGERARPSHVMGFGRAEQEPHTQNFRF